MAKDEILGISANLDISDIQKNIDELNRQIGTIGEKSEEAGKKISESFSNIDLSKIQQLMQSAEAEIVSLQKSIHANSEEIQRFEKEIFMAQTAMKNGGSTEQLTTQIKEYSKAIEDAKQNNKVLVSEHDALQSSLTSLAQKYNILAQSTNAGQTVSTALAAASAVAHASTAAAVGAESLAHSENTAKISEETQKTQENIETKKSLKEELKMLRESFSEISTELDKYDEKVAKQERAVASAAQSLEKFKESLSNGNIDSNEAGFHLLEKQQRKYDEAVEKLELMKQVQDRLLVDWHQYSREIDETNKKLNESSSAHNKNSEEAKKTAEETKKIGKGADEATKKVSGIFSKVKGSFSGILKGDFSGLFGVIGKLGAWGAAIAAVGKGLYELSVRAEQFRVALQPLSNYIDSDKLKDVRQNILALSDETTKSVADMAKAATAFVKVWDSLRDSPAALTKMIKASNEFGALAGKTSEDAAKELSNLAGTYHLTAREAAEVSNIVASATRNSTNSFAEMASALASAGQYASTYGISFREMASLIGYSSNNFGGASTAASKFNMVLMTMGNLQSEYNPRIVGLVQALENLKAAYDKGEPVQDKFNKRTRAAAMYFINNAAAIKTYSNRIDDNKTKTELLADINTRASVNVEKLKNAWDGFLTSLNANLTPTLTNILKFFTEVIGGAQKTADELQYIANYGKRHDATKNQRYVGGITSGFISGFAENRVAMAGAKEMDEPDMEAYRTQRDKVYAYYDKMEKALRKKWAKASAKAISNAAGNLTVQYYNKNRDTAFNVIAPGDFNYLLKEKRSATISLDAHPTNVTGNNNDYDITDSKAKEQAKKQRQYREEQAEQNAKLEAETKKLEWELYVTESEKAIAEIHDANEKEIAQRKLDFAKKKHSIEQEAEQMRQTNISAAKAMYDKNPANENKEGYYASGLDKKVTLNDKQQKTINAKYDTLSSQQRAETEKSLKAVTDKYKTENQQRADIEKKYNDDIAKIQRARVDKEKELAEATTEEKKRQLEQQISDLVAAEAKATADKGEAIVAFDFAQLKKNPEYVAAFEDLSNVSTETLTNLIKLFEQFKLQAAESMSPDQLREYTSTLESMYDALSGRENPFKQVAEASVEYSNANAAVKAITKKLDALKKGQKTVRNATKEEIKLTEAYDTEEKAEKALQKAKDKRNKAEKKYTKAVKNLHEKINELADAITNVGQTIGGTEGQILQLIGSVLNFVTTTSAGIKSVAATGAQAISTIEKASVILTIISAAIQLLQAMSSLFKDSHAQYEEFAKTYTEINKLTNSVNAYKLAVIEANNAQRNWFTSTGLSELHDAWEYNQQALANYIEAATQAQAIYQNETGDGWLTKSAKWIGSTVGKLVSLPGKLISKGLSAMGVDMGGWLGKVADWSVDGMFGGVEAIVGKAVGNIIDNASNYKKGTTAAINNLRIETKHKSSGFLGTGIGGHSQKTQDLRTWAKENYGDDLFDENGWINTELANQIIDDYGDKLVGETKETLETLIEIKEEYDKFVEQIEEYVSEMYSPLADDLTDALWDWLSEGEDVMDKFKEYASDTFADIAKEIIKSQITSSFFSTFSDSVKEIYKMYGMGAIDESQLASSVKDSTKTLLSTIQTQLPALQEVLKAMDEQFKELGIDIAGAEQSEQSATSKAIEAITEDQADTLTGIGYAMQIALEQGNATRIMMQVDVAAMRTTADIISANISEMRDIQYQGLSNLQTIVKNTAPIIIMNETMDNIYKLMKERY